jgi:hypothetical protein
MIIVIRSPHPHPLSALSLTPRRLHNEHVVRYYQAWYDWEMPSDKDDQFDFSGKEVRFFG